MQQNNLCLFKIFMITLFALLAVEVQSQQIVSYPIDMLTELNNGSVQALVEPAFTKGAIETIFDGNRLTEAAITNNNYVQITLLFDAPKIVSKCKLFFWNPGQWSLEIANSQDDLNLKSGTYQLLVNERIFKPFAWDSLDFTPVEGKALRLMAKNLQSNSVLIGEWQIYSSITMSSLLILPNPLRLIPGTSTQLSVKLVDTAGKSYPYELDEPVSWSSNNPAVATVGEMGDVHAHALGTSEIIARTAALSGSTTAHVLEDFESIKAEPLIIKVALVLQDPVIDSTNMRKIHQVRGWTDPMRLIDQILEAFSETSHGVIKFKIVEKHDDSKIFSRLDGNLMSIDTIAYYYSSNSRLYGRETPGTLQYMTEIQNRVKFDYLAMIDYYEFDTKRNSNEIHEVWVYGPPFGGMYESQLVGPNAFWYNSPPLNHPGLEKLLSVMGWNYERGVAEAIHSFGHRAESAIVHAYERWDVHEEQPTYWEIFTRIDKELPGKAHIGNIHFPPNGMSDYDYGNRNYVVTYADNWKRYPFLLDQTRTINCQEWGCSQLGYMKWWHSHLPRFTGVTDGILNNWWHYIVDYEGAVELAEKLTIDIHEKDDEFGVVPTEYSLSQNYPNPFNPETTIKFSIKESQHITIQLYDTLGRQVKKIIDKLATAGNHEVKFNGKDLASGVYFYKLIAGDFHSVKKLVILK